MGDAVLGVRLHGDPRRPEPDSFRVHFPGGVVDLERCTDGSYWVHVIADLKQVVEDREGPQEEHGRPYSKITEARLHSTEKSTAKMDLGDFESPGLYDVALRVVRDK